ncbi:MAG: pyridoxamine 5'-phosphate oxidase family protein [Steroidobacteraceae bacterium]
MLVRPQATPEWRRLADLIAEIDVAMLTTARPDGNLHSRPLRTLQMDGEGGLWFMTRISSSMIAEMDGHRRVSLSYCRPARQRYVWAAGVTQILRDEDKASEVWSVELRPWLPEGRDDPESVLLKVTVEEAEYWDPGQRGMIPLLSAAGAAGAERSVRLRGHGASH